MIAKCTASPKKWFKRSTFNLVCVFVFVFAFVFVFVVVVVVVVVVFFSHLPGEGC